MFNSFRELELAQSWRKLAITEPELVHHYNLRTFTVFSRYRSDTVNSNFVNSDFALKSKYFSNLVMVSLNH